MMAWWISASLLSQADKQPQRLPVRASTAPIVLNKTKMSSQSDQLRAYQRAPCSTLRHHLGQDHVSADDFLKV